MKELQQNGEGKEQNGVSTESNGTPSTNGNSKQLALTKKAGEFNNIKLNL